jgi:hypothetical protein
MIVERKRVFSGMRIGKGNRSTRKKSAPFPICPQIPNEINFDSTRASAAKIR